MGYRIEFPDYDGHLYIPKGWEDNSWHNDVCPRAMKRTPDETIEYSIWQDYVDPDRRERGSATKRYLFQITVGYDNIFNWETDSLEEIKALVNAVEQ